METAVPRLTLDRIPTAARTGLVRYPVPLTGVRMAVLHLPPALSRPDVERLVDFIVGLALEEDPPWDFDPLKTHGADISAASPRPPVAELIQRLLAWSYDDRLGDGMLLRHAAAALAELSARKD